MCHFTPAIVLLWLFALPASSIAADYRCLDGVTPPLAHSGAQLRVASLNIAHGRGSALNQMLIGQRRIEENLDAVGELMTRIGAQVVALQELDADSLWSGGFDHAGRLLEASHYFCAALGLHARTWLYQFGTGLLSEVALNEPRARHFEPTPPTTTKGLVGATLQWRDGHNTRPVRLVSVHLDFSRRGARERQLIDIIEAIGESPEPVVLMGDFNEEWREDSVVRRLVEEAGMVAFAPQSEALATYKDKRLDWILISGELEFVSYRVVADEVSDHRFVVADIQWSNGS
jgi:endonuclease/exonuclease/phosphatase family metal-dependent hydrolase